MALIKCPECNNQISDKADACPHCGMPVKEMLSKISKRECPECGAMVEAESEECPECGYVFSEAEKKQESLEKFDDEKIDIAEKNAKGRDKKKEKKPVNKKRIITIAGISAGALVLIALFLFFLSPITFKWFCFHRHTPATCTAPETCKRCGTTWGDPLGHTWIEATCYDPAICAVCSETMGDPKGHDWKAATCTQAQRCNRCGETQGNAKGHSYSSATCTEAKKCKVCGAKDGFPLGHNVANYMCKRCGETIATRADVKNILDITTFRYSIGYFGSIDQTIGFKNKSDTLTINYITIKMSFLNAVGDKLTDTYSGKDYASVRYTGPLKPGASTGSLTWDNSFYNKSFSGTVCIEEIKIEYSDGSVLILDSSTANGAVVAWRD